LLDDVGQFINRGKLEMTRDELKAQIKAEIAERARCAEAEGNPVIIGSRILERGRVKLLSSPPDDERLLELGRELLGKCNDDDALDAGADIWGEALHCFIMQTDT
jgi:hypothetical protein